MPNAFYFHNFEVKKIFDFYSNNYYHQLSITFTESNKQGLGPTFENGLRIFTELIVTHSIEDTSIGKLSVIALVAKEHLGVLKK